MEIEPTDVQQIQEPTVTIRLFDRALIAKMVTVDLMADGTVTMPTVDPEHVAHSPAVNTLSELAHRLGKLVAPLKGDKEPVMVPAVEIRTEGIVLTPPAGDELEGQFEIVLHHPALVRLSDSKREGVSDHAPAVISMATSTHLAG